MLRFLLVATPATFSAYLALSTAQNTAFPASLTAIVCGFGTAAIWHAIRLALQRIHRTDRDAAMMAGGYCPVCEKPRTLEVTSDEHETPIRVRCGKCAECFSIEQTPNGPLVTRHGRGYIHDHD